MNADDLKSWLAIALGIIAILGHAKGFFSSGEKKIAEDIDNLDAKVEKQDQLISTLAQRLLTAEGELRHLPSKDDVAALRLSLAELTGTVGVLAKGFEGVSNTVHNIDNWLREKGTK